MCYRKVIKKSIDSGHLAFLIHTEETWNSLSSLQYCKISFEPLPESDHFLHSQGEFRSAPRTMTSKHRCSNGCRIKEEPVSQGLHAERLCHATVLTGKTFTINDVTWQSNWNTLRHSDHVILSFGFYEEWLFSHFSQSLRFFMISNSRFETISVWVFLAIAIWCILSQVRAGTGMKDPKQCREGDWCRHDTWINNKGTVATQFKLKLSYPLF